MVVHVEATQDIIYHDSTQRTEGQPSFSPMLIYLVLAMALPETSNRQGERHRRQRLLLDDGNRIGTEIRYHNRRMVAN